MSDKNPTIAYELAKTRQVVYIDDNIGERIGKLSKIQSGQDALNLIDELDKRLKEAYIEIERLRSVKEPDTSSLRNDLISLVEKHGLSVSPVAVG